MKRLAKELAESLLRFFASYLLNMKSYEEFFKDPLMTSLGQAFDSVNKLLNLTFRNNLYKQDDLTDQK
ncbi:MAG: hypothetical protein HWD61_12010 [Parachlamydiaceae bacterium]|nr:MAG: hypothetical protein HWD61_12010 [Parachlamydiaceae bacterium]